MAIEFVCPHCLTGYKGLMEYGTEVRCDACLEDFVTLPFLGEQSTMWNQTVGGFYSLFAGEQCPACSKRSAASLGSKGGGQRVIEGKWHNVWADYWLCKDCGSMWCYAKNAEA